MNNRGFDIMIQVAPEHNPDLKMGDFGGFTSGGYVRDVSDVPVWQTCPPGYKRATTPPFKCVPAQYYGSGLLGDLQGGIKSGQRFGFTTLVFAPLAIIGIGAVAIFAIAMVMKKKGKKKEEYSADDVDEKYRTMFDEFCKKYPNIASMLGDGDDAVTGELEEHIVAKDIGTEHPAYDELIELGDYRNKHFAEIHKTGYEYSSGKGISNYIVDDGVVALMMQGHNANEVAHEYVDEGAYGQDGDQTVVVDVTVWELRNNIDIEDEDNIDPDDRDTWEHLVVDEDGDEIKVEIQPKPPKCERDYDEWPNHDWQSPQEVVGGLDENPGVYGSNGGVKVTEVCSHCGKYKITDTGATDHTGQTFTSIRYIDADDESLEWVESIEVDKEDAYSSDDNDDNGYGYYRVFGKESGYVVVKAKTEDEAVKIANEYQDSDTSRILKTNIYDYKNNHFSLKNR